MRRENAEVEGKDLISLDTADVHRADRNALETEENVLHSMFTSDQEPEEDSPKEEDEEELVFVTRTRRGRGIRKAARYRD